MYKYGVDDIQGIGFTGSLANGAEILSEAISGKVDVNGAAINRILMDSAYLGIFDFDEFVDTTIDLVVASGLVDYLEADIRKNIWFCVALLLYHTFPEKERGLIKFLKFFAAS